MDKWMFLGVEDTFYNSSISFLLSSIVGSDHVMEIDFPYPDIYDKTIKMLVRGWHTVFSKAPIRSANLNCELTTQAIPVW